MKLKTEVTNILTGQKWNTVHSSPEDRDLWLTVNKNTNAFGKSERRIIKGSESYDPILFLNEEAEEGPDFTTIIYVNLKSEYIIGEAEDITIQENEKEELEEMISAGEKSKRYCDDILNLIRGHNKKNNVDSLSVGQMKQLFKAIQEYLNDGQPEEAIAAIEAVNDPNYKNLKDVILKYKNYFMV